MVKVGTLAVVALWWLPCVAACAAAEPSAAPAPPALPPVSAYPAARREATQDVLFGVTIADPYRWLEQDIRKSLEVRDWAGAQNQLTADYLARLPNREAIRRRLTQVWDFEKLGAPRRRGGRLFFTRNSGLQNQASIYVQDSEAGAPRLLVDANADIGAGDIVGLDWTPSDDGRLVVFTTQPKGGDWRSLRVVDAATGRLLPDVVENLKTREFAWTADGKGLFYNAYDRPNADDRTTSAVASAVYLHRLGDPQTADREVYRGPAGKSGLQIPQTTHDGRWLVITTSDGGETRQQVRVMDLSKPGAPLRLLVTPQRDRWRFVGAHGGRLLFQTTDGAERERIVSLDPEGPADQPPRVVVPEAPIPILRAVVAGDELVVQYLEVAHSVLKRFGFDGTPRGAIALGPHDVAFGLEGLPGDDRVYYLASSMVRAPTVYSFDLKRGAAGVFRAPRAAWNPDAFTIREITSTSADGTKVPVTFAYRKGLDLSKGAPLIQMAYGGFGISPGLEFYESRFAWVDMGGVFAIAHVRGGAEYGKAWYEVARKAGRLKTVQDFVGATLALQAAGVTTPAQSVAYGSSNGGLLTAAVANARPDLYAVALPRVPVTDMLRYTRFTLGRIWVDELGDPDKAEDFKGLLAYSPLHNIKAGARYPAILVNTADTDDRVVPAHSFKYVAALQAADIGERPHLLRIDTDVGHGEGKPTDKLIAEFTDLWTFAAAGTGLEPKLPLPATPPR